MFLALPGCATVSVIETTSVADVSLTSGQSNLEKSAKAYHKTVKSIGVEESGSPLDMFSSWFGGEENNDNAYWRRVGADDGVVANVRETVSADVSETAVKLSAVNKAAAELLVEAGDGGAPTKSDVAELETVLISVRHAREAFVEALDRVNKRTSMPVNSDLVLSPLDEEIAFATRLADELAAARMSGALSSVSTMRT